MSSPPLTCPIPPTHTHTAPPSGHLALSVPTSLTLYISSLPPHLRSSLGHASLWVTCIVLSDPVSQPWSGSLPLCTAVSVFCSFFGSLPHCLCLCSSLCLSGSLSVTISLYSCVSDSLSLLYFPNSHSLYPPPPYHFPLSELAPGVDNINHSGLGWH